MADHNKEKPTDYHVSSKEIYMEGYVAWHSGVEDNPHPYNTDAADDWDTGWLAAEDSESEDDEDEE